MDLDESFKTRLRWALESHVPPVTQAELARHLGISIQAVSQWMSGLTKSPRRAVLARAANYLNVRLEWLAYARGPMRASDVAATDATQPPSSGAREAMILAREWEAALASALPEGSETHLHHSVPHPTPPAKIRLDWLSDDVVAVLGLYSQPATLVAAARQRLWQLLLARELLPPVPGRRAVLLLAPLDENREAPSRHIDALRSEARLFNVDVLHAGTPDAAAALLLGEEARQPVPLEDELGLDSSPIL